MRGKEGQLLATPLTIYTVSLGIKNLAGIHMKTPDKSPPSNNEWNLWIKSYLSLHWWKYTSHVVLVSISASRLDNFIVGVTNTSSNVTAPVRNMYPLCGQYPTAASQYAKMTQFCLTSTPPGRYVIIQQPVSGVGYMTICELEVFGCSPPLFW